MLKSKQNKVLAIERHLVFNLGIKVIFFSSPYSVAVPLIPPPDGEKFEGGYSVERNPITGGAKLVPPSGGKNQIRF